MQNTVTFGPAAGNGLKTGLGCTMEKACFKPRQLRLPLWPPRWRRTYKRLTAKPLTDDGWFVNCGPRRCNPWRPRRARRLSAPHSTPG